MSETSRPSTRTEDLAMLRRAASLALRGHGGAEPNPMVGCVIVGADGRVVGEGYHRRCGGPHAEVNALRSAGSQAQNATAYVTLEPCAHTGRTGPCSVALIEAGVSHVVIGNPEETAVAAGGAAALRAAGVTVTFIDSCTEAREIYEPFAYRQASGLPWVIAKWAQSIDGRVATRTGDSQWISGPQSRRLVHRQRGRSDVILTGIGTVLHDDPLLTARDVSCRRVARRVVIDPKLQIPHDSALVRTAGEVPLTVACHASIIEAATDKVNQLQARGVELLGIAMDGDDLPLAPVLRQMVTGHEVATVFVEAGPGLMSRLFRQQLVNEAWVFIGPLLIGDDQAAPALRGFSPLALNAAVRTRLIGTHRRGDDMLLRYRLSP